jgi:hypothetical protein
MVDQADIPAQAGIQYVLDSGRTQASGLPPSRERRKFFISLLVDTASAMRASSIAGIEAAGGGYVERSVQ